LFAQRDNDLQKSRLLLTALINDDVFISLINFSGFKIARIRTYNISKYRLLAPDGTLFEAFIEILFTSLEIVYNALIFEILIELEKF